MKLKATFSTLALLGSLTGHAQNQTVNGNLTVTGNMYTQGDPLLGDAGGNVEWIFSHNASGLYLTPGYYQYSKRTAFYPNGQVAFANQVSIGNVSCTNQGACTGGSLNINSLALAVGGTIGAQKAVYVVNVGGTWPDYVFRPGYRLRPLSEVAQYIQANQHLPDVPSATQVASEGIELVSMNATLLQKVEELTLHLIALQQANQALADRLAKLEATNQPVKP